MSRRRATRKPTNVRVTVDWSNPLSRGLMGAWFMTERAGRYLANSVDHQMTALGSGVDFDGPVLSFSSSGNDTDVRAALDDFTCLVDVTLITDVFATSRLVDKDYVNGFWMGSTNAGIASTVYGGGVMEGASPYGRYVDVGTLGRHQFASRRAGTTHHIIADAGAYSTSGTVSDARTDTTTFGLGWSGGSNSWTGFMHSALLFSRALSDGEIYSLQRNPYQLLRQRSAYDIGAWAVAMTGQPWYAYAQQG